MSLPTINGYPLGYTPDLTALEDKVYLAVAPFKDLPSKADSKDWSPVRNQGQLGSCTAFAVKQVIEVAAHVDDGVQVALSALDAYLGGRKALGTINVDSGSRPKDVIEYANRIGLASEALWPYDITKFRVEPPTDARQQGARHTIVDFASVETSFAAKDAIARGYAVAFGMTLYSNFGRIGSNGQFPRPEGGVAGGHAMSIIGYDDAVDNVFWGVKGAFRVKNSWSTGFGDHGYFWLPYTVYDMAIVSDAWTVYTIK